MRNTQILIIGAGAAGLMAAYTLTKAGKNVTILEARNRIGGRIHTLDDASFFKHAELGAEFVHGNLPVTLRLLHEAGLEYYSAWGEMWHYHEGKFGNEPQQNEDWGLLMKKLNALESDIPLAEFLGKEFGDKKYAAMRESVRRFVSGYDTADINVASSFALRDEWQNEDEDAQYRVDGGYCKLIDYLADESRANGAELLLNTIARDILWKDGKVRVITNDGIEYEAEKLIVALPLGILKADDAISFHPSINQYQNAISNIGFGAIIKVLLEFRDIFWEDEEITKLVGSSLKEMGFLLSDEEIPTWWTQYPKHSSVLTGWFGGPAAAAKKDTSNEEIFQQAITSLANIFKRDADKLKDNLVAWNVINWTADPFTRGSYAYDTVQSHNARKILAEPVSNTIYFAGEYLYEGPAMGTVEAALTSGEEVGKRIINE